MTSDGNPNISTAKKTYSQVASSEQVFIFLVT